MATRYLITGGGSVIWDGSNTAIWSTTSGGATGASVPVAGDDVIMDALSGGGTVTLGYSPTVTSITMGAFTGTFSVSTFSPIMNTFNCSGTGTRTLNMGSGTWILVGSGTTIWTTATTTNLTLNPETSTINCTYSGGTGTRTFITGSASVNNLSISAGTDTWAFSTTPNVGGNLNFTGFTGTWGNNSVNIGGDLVMGTGMTKTAGGGTIAFTATSGTKTITTNGVTISNPINFNGTGGSWLLNDDIVGTMTSSGTMSLGVGTLNFNNKNVTRWSFS